MTAQQPDPPDGAIPTTRLLELYNAYGQSPWLDNIRRNWIANGELDRRVRQGVRGITSNPTIFQKAITSTTDYDSEFTAAVADGLDVEDAYWRMVVSDITAAASVLRSVYDNSDGLDGFVSVEVSPRLARDSAATAAAARHLNERISVPNLYVKIPGTVEGLPAISAMISEKRNVNVTLIFSVERYHEVAEAYITGLEQASGDLSAVSSVASFFISRIDTAVDRCLEEIDTEEALALRGKAAIASAKVAYADFQQIYRGPRWDALAERGARPQRLLWASTSTKNPAYPDTVYVDQLIGPHTVNTLPDSALDAFEDHGTLGCTLSSRLTEARDVLTDLVDLDVDMAEVVTRLEEEGITAFSDSFDDLLEVLTQKAVGITL